MQKKYIRNICKPLRLGSCKWMLQMIKINDYLVHFLVPDGVTATKISRKEFIDVLEDRILYQWKLEFEKEGFNLSSSTLEEFLDVCVHLEEAELQKLLRKMIARARKNHDDNGKKKHQDKPKSRHERCHGLGKRHQGKRKKKATGSTFSPRTISQNSRGSGRSVLSRMPKGRPKSMA
eukprot:14326791-Ditylum_brightwellii.AAC.2